MRQNRTVSPKNLFGRPVHQKRPQAFTRPLDITLRAHDLKPLGFRQRSSFFGLGELFVVDVVCSTIFQCVRIRARLDVAQDEVRTGKEPARLVADKFWPGRGSKVSMKLEIIWRDRVTHQPCDTSSTSCLVACLYTAQAMPEQNRESRSGLRLPAFGTRHLELEYEMMPRTP